MGTITFAGHGGSSAMGAVDDVMPTAYGESFDIISGTMDTGGNTGTQIFNAIGSAGSNNMIHYTSGDLVTDLRSQLHTFHQELVKLKPTDFAIEYTGLEGLTLGYASGEDNAAGGTGNFDNSTMYVKYAYGPVTVGMQESEQDAEAATNDHDFTSMGIVQVSDDLTIGYTASEFNHGNYATDQENSNLSAAYTMGGMTLSIAMAEEKNEVTTAAADDVKGYAINLAFAF